MTERRGPGGADGWLRERPRWVRLSVALAGTVLIWGSGAVAWHLLLGHSWEDSVSFAVVLGITVTGGQWLATAIRRKQTDHRGS
ncbi:hypothetical protein [Streptomyces sp. NPDC004014]